MATTHDDAGTAPPGPSSSAAGRREYEFNDAEDRIIQDLGSKMGFTGLFMVGMGLCFAVSVIERWSREFELNVGLLFLTTLFVVLGVWTHRAGAEFRRIVDSKGRDVTLLMSALASLLRCYRLISLLFFVGLVFAVIQLVATNLRG